MLKRWALALLFGLPGLAAAADSGSGVAVVNGVALVVRVLELRGHPQQLAARMVQQWRKDPAVDWVHLEALQQRTVIAQRRGALHVTASLTAGPRPHETRVVVSVLDLRQPRPKPRWRIPVQAAGSSWVSVVESAPGVAEYLGFVPVPLPQARQRWVAALRRAGFTATVVSDHRIDAQAHGLVVGVVLQPAADGTSIVLQTRGSPP